MADLHWGFESTDTSVQERSSRGKHYTQDTALLLTVGANETATINEIFLHARSNSANWVVLFSIYSCDSNGNPSTSIWNGTSDPVPGNGSRTFYCATGGVQLTAGNYILALTPTSGSVLDLYVTGPAGGEIMQGIQADNSLDWVEDTADKLLVNKNHFWAKGTIESSVEPPPDGTWGRPYEEDTTTLENSLRDYTYTQNSDLILNVGAGQSVLVDDIYLHARSNGANWQVVLAIYTCDANGLPDQPVWNSLSNSAPKAGAFVFTADAAGLRLEEGNYTLCWAPYTGSVLDVYNTTLASGTIYQGGQDDTNQPWEDDVERHLFGDVQIWADIRGDLGSGNAIDDVNGNNEVVIGEDIIINGTFNSPLQSVEIIGEYTTGCVIGTSDSDSIECWPMAFAAWRCKIGGAGLVLRVNFSNGDPSVEIPVVLINESGWQHVNVENMDITLMAQGIPYATNGDQMSTPVDVAGSILEVYPNTEGKYRPAVPHGTQHSMRWYDAETGYWEDRLVTVNRPSGEGDPPTWNSTPTPPTASVGEPYSYPIGNHLDGDRPMVLTDIGTPLPAGLSYDVSVEPELISGTPTETGEFDGIITDANNGL